jgi:hypothetical protein
VLLPCNVVVYEDGDGTVVEAMNPIVALALGTSPALAAIAHEVAGRLLNAVGALGLVTAMSATTVEPCDEFERLRVDVEALERIFEVSTAAMVRSVLPRLPDGAALDRCIRQTSRERVAEALVHTQRAAAAVQRLSTHDAAMQPALTEQYHLIAVLERHAWQDAAD